jgi:AraC-like DNA-binding protein
MTIINTNLKEMMFDIPIPSFSENNGLEESRMVVDNRYVEASFAEIRTPLFSIMDGSVCSRDDLRVYSHMEENDVLWFCAALQGQITCFYNPLSREENWRSGQANLISYSNVDSCSCFKKDKPFRMLEIMLSRKYLEKTAEACPFLFDEMLRLCRHHELFRYFPENRLFCPAIGNALNDILNYKSAGNLAPLYLDAKILEILSLFLCNEQKECSACTGSCPPQDNGMLVRAKEIIEQQYLNPPSLHHLALMVGTNECNLKSGFKTLFGTTVFGYLFDYRMKLACRYLSDADRTIQEIAELTGYEYHSHFSTAFKRKFNVSPQEYRSRKS